MRQLRGVLEKATTVFEYMSQANVAWCCDHCTTQVKKLIKVDTTTEIINMKLDMNETFNSLKKTFMDDFFYFMDGTKVGDQAASLSTEDSSIWKQQLIAAKPLKEISLEAENEQKREGDLRCKKNLIFHRAPESKVTASADPMKHDLNMINE